MDILHEIATDRIFCSRQAVANLLSKAYQLGHKAGVEKGRRNYWLDAKRVIHSRWMVADDIKKANEMDAILKELAELNTNKDAK